VQCVFVQIPKAVTMRTLRYFYPKKKGRNKKKKTYSLKYILSRSNKIKLFKRGMVLIQRDN